MRCLGTVLLATLILACSTRKTETSTNVQDSVQADSTSALANEPAPATLAFSAVTGFTVKNAVAVEDTVNFFLIGSEEEFNKLFAKDKNQGEVSKPDFQINYVVGVVCKSTDLATTIALDKVEVGNDINVYLTVQRGEKQKTTTKPSQIFAIERRDGINAMQFFVNGKADKALLLTAN